MNNSFWQVMSYALIPALAVLIGGITTVFWKPAATFRSLVQHFAAGLVFAAVAVEITTGYYTRKRSVCHSSRLCIGYRFDARCQVFRRKRRAKRCQ